MVARVVEKNIVNNFICLLCFAVCASWVTALPFAADCTLVICVHALGRKQFPTFCFTASVLMVYRVCTMGYRLAIHGGLYYGLPVLFAATLGLGTECMCGRLGLLVCR